MSHSRHQLFAGLDQVPVLGEVRYGRKTLRSGMFVGGPIQIAVAKILYNGGEIDSGKFELVEYVRPGSSHRLNAVIVLRPPRLSAVEREILGRVPATQSEVHLGEATAAWLGTVDEVGNFYENAYDVRAADKATNINTADIIDKVYDDVKKVVDDAKDLTKDFWDKAAQVQEDQKQQQEQEVQEQQDQEVQEQQDQEQEQDVADAEGGRFSKLVDELAASDLSPTASARALLTLRAQLIIAGEFSKFSRRLASAARGALGTRAVPSGSRNR